jgi:hypothetical protein
MAITQSIYKFGFLDRAGQVHKHSSIMPAKQFYLLGEPVSSARNIDVDPTSDLDGLKDLIAAHFAIVESSGKLEGNFFFIILGLND